MKKNHYTGNPKLIKNSKGDFSMEKNTLDLFDNIIFAEFMPKNSDMQMIVKDYLYAYTNGVNKAIEAIFSNNASGCNGKAIHDNLLPVVQFAKELEMSCYNVLTANSEEQHNVCKYIKSIIHTLEKCSERAEEPERQLHYPREILFGNELLELLKEKDGYIQLVNIYQLILDNWKDIKELSSTYRLLCCLAKLGCNWNDSPEIRLKFLKIIKLISDDWETCKG